MTHSIRWARWVPNSCRGMTLVISKRLGLFTTDVSTRSIDQGHPCSRFQRAMHLACNTRTSSVSTLASAVRPTPSGRGREWQTRSSPRWWNGRPTSSDASRPCRRVACRWLHGSEHAQQTGSTRAPEGCVIQQRACGQLSRLTAAPAGLFRCSGHSIGPGHPRSSCRGGQSGW